MEDRPLIPIRTSVVVYVTLLRLLLVNTAMAYVHLGRYWNNGISVAIGVTQFCLVFL